VSNSQKKSNLEDEVICENLVGDTHSESGAEASDVEDYFEEEEEEEEEEWRQQRQQQQQQQQQQQA
jgi:hypothetical protein